MQMNLVHKSPLTVLTPFKSSKTISHAKTLAVTSQWAHTTTSSTATTTNKKNRKEKFSLSVWGQPWNASYGLKWVWKASPLQFDTFSTCGSFWTGSAPAFLDRCLSLCISDQRVSFLLLLLIFCSSWSLTQRHAETVAWPTVMVCLHFTPSSQGSGIIVKAGAERLLRTRGGRWLQ